MKELIRFLAVCLLLTTQYVSAIEVKGLFSVEVVAHSQSREDRNLALREALVIVLNRITTTKELMLNPAVREALSSAGSYVDQYQYIQMRNNTNDISQLKIRVAFNQKTLLALMHKNRLAIWPKMRNQVLVWIVLEQGGQQAVLDTEQNAEIDKTLQAVAQLKGIPVLLPLMDLEERLSINVEDIANANPEKIQQISLRYDASAILSGIVIKQRSCWRSEWSLSFNDKVEQWSIPCENLSANLSTALQKVYDHLSVFNAVKSW